MDTRAKIIGEAEACRLASAGATVVSGYFDPLLAAHAERLAGLKRNGTPLVVLIASPQNAILPAPARAELVAGLRVVDHVVVHVAADQVTGARIAPQIHLEEEDAAGFHRLVEHVQARQLARS